MKIAKEPISMETPICDDDGSAPPREAKALRKLKHPSRSDKLRSFIDTM
jgi:DNA-directed RNA polymerase sigma subunit (sigma70/sigma32)